MFEKINNQIVESDRDRSRRVGTIVSILENSQYLVRIEGYTRTAKLNARLDAKYRVGDVVKLEPIGFNNKLEITGRTGARRYTEKIVDEQLQELLNGTSFNASQISFDDSEVMEGYAIDLVQDVIDYLLTKIYALEDRCDALESRVTALESRVTALE